MASAEKEAPRRHSPRERRSLSPRHRRSCSLESSRSSGCMVGLASLASCRFPLCGDCLQPARLSRAASTPSGLSRNSSSRYPSMVDLRDIEVEVPVEPVASWATGCLSNLTGMETEASSQLEEAPAPEAAKEPLSLKLLNTSWQISGDLATFINSMREQLLASARAQSSATIAVHIPAGFALPSERQICKYGLRHPADAPGWHGLTDGSAIGLLQLRSRKDSRGESSDGESVISGISGQSGRGEGQAQALLHVRLRVVALLASQLNDGRHLLELWRISIRDCHEVLNQMAPGMRAWPVHDNHVRREVLLNMARERFRHLRTFLGLDRGRGYLDVVRLHFGEEVAFLFAWQAHYVTSLFCLALLTVPFMVVQIGSLWAAWGASYDILAQTMLVVMFGVAVTEIWPIQAERKVHRWHSRSECLTRWHMLVLGILESRGSRLKQFSIEQICEEEPADHYGTAPDTVEEQAEEAYQRAMHGLKVGVLPGGWACTRLKRLLRALLLLSVLVLQWAMILLFFNFIVWFEIWVIFDWGGCWEYNRKVGETKCVSADELRGVLGVIMGALPSICEGAFFELLLAISRATANSFISLYNFPTHEGKEFATVAVVFGLEVVGKVGFILMLALAFVPVWNERDAEGCPYFWDRSLLGRNSLACLKGKVPYEARLNMMRSAMKGPMLVSGLVGILVKTLVPLLLESWRRCTEWDAPRAGIKFWCCHLRIRRLILAPLDFVLRVLTFIFQADHEVVGGVQIFCRWPAALDVHPTRRSSIFSSQSQEEATKMKGQKRLWRALLEGQRREFDPFNEYIEVLLHFLWISCFAIVWPLGCAFALLNQLLEYRFDALKLLSVRRRRFPSTRHMSVAWVPKFALFICHIGIFVNVAILMLPYRLASHLGGSKEVLERIEDIEPILSSSEWPMIFLLFIFLWAFLVTLRAVCIWLVKRTLPYLLQTRSFTRRRTSLHHDREAEDVRREQGPVAYALDGFCVTQIEHREK